MKNKMTLLIALVAVLAIGCAVAVPQAVAGDLTYSTLAPQTGDTDLVIKNKQAVTLYQTYLTATSSQPAEVQAAAHALAVSSTSASTAAVALAAAYAGDSVANISATGTSSVVGTVLRRLVINKAGSADSQIVLTGTGGAAIGTVSAGAQGALEYGVLITGGTLTLVTTGTTAPNVSVGYK
jgi:Flp pilus assembly pilin Flp